MLAAWAARDEQPILPTSTNPCITRAAGTQGINPSSSEIHQCMALTLKNIANTLRLSQKDFPMVANLMYGTQAS
jgi:hypothetical protein